MPTAQQDTEITLGIGRMLIIFFSFVLVCALFFSFGFSLGRRTTIASAGALVSATAGIPATIVRPSAAKNGVPQPAPQSDEFSFYKAVGEKTADVALTPQDLKAAPATSSAAASGAEAPPKPATEAAASAPTPAPASIGYYVQVAAVSRLEDAESLVEALKKKQYPAFTANNNSTDKFYRVQVGRVFWQIEQPGAGGPDGATHRVGLV